MSAPARHRRCIVLRGEPEATRREAERLTSALEAVEWLSGARGAAARSRRRLGRTFDAVVLDLHEGASADVLGRCHGLVRGGGALVLRLPPAAYPPRRRELAVYPFTVADVTARFWARLERELARLDTAPPAEPLRPPPRPSSGSPEQERVVEQLVQVFTRGGAEIVALLADRGRGKSSALGLALARALSQAPITAWVSGPSEDATVELARFAAPARGERLRFVPPEELLGEGRPDLVVVDEAAQLSVPLLRAVVERHRRAALAFATTTHGYEGTGRGFVRRFLDRLGESGRPSTRLALETPIRWEAGDPLERFTHDLLALDAEPPAALPLGAAPAPRHVTKDELARDEGLLRGVFGLLAGAHYRTTPGDLERLLDAPNLEVHAIVGAGQVLAATVVAIEGGLPKADCEALERGAWRLRGHALADTLIVHGGRADAGELRMLRSVRIATHPSLRQRGLARALVEHVHREHAVELFGTVFGATAELLEFRRSVGYSLVRLGSSRGASSGEPSVVMLRPASERARRLIAELRAELARNLPLQLELLEADGPLPLDPRLRAALAADLEPPPELTPTQLRAQVERFAGGAQTMEAAAYALDAFLRQHAAELGHLGARERCLLEARVLRREGWPEAAREAGYEGAPAAMRALRPAVARLLAATAARR